jgi:hypothetical protein
MVVLAILGLDLMMITQRGAATLLPRIRSIFEPIEMPWQTFKVADATIGSITTPELKEALDTVWTMISQNLVDELCRDFLECRQPCLENADVRPVLEFTKLWRIPGNRPSAKCAMEGREKPDDLGFGRPAWNPLEEGGRAPAGLFTRPNQTHGEDARQ